MALGLAGFLALGKVGVVRIGRILGRDKCWEDVVALSSVLGGRPSGLRFIPIAFRKEDESRRDFSHSEEFFCLGYLCH